MPRSVSVALCVVIGVATLDAANKEQERLENAGVMEEILNAPDNIPRELLQKAYGPKITARRIVTGNEIGVPDAGRHFVAVLGKNAPRNDSAKTPNR